MNSLKTKRIPSAIASATNAAQFLTSLSRIKAMNVKTGGKFSSIEYTKPVYGKKSTNGGALIGFVVSNYNAVQINTEYANRKSVRDAVAKGERFSPELKKNEVKFEIDGIKLKHNTNTGNTFLPVNYSKNGAVQYFLVNNFGDKIEVSKEQFSKNPALLAKDNPCAKKSRPSRSDLQELGQELYKDLMIDRITAIK